MLSGCLENSFSVLICPFFKVQFQAHLFFLNPHYVNSVFDWLEHSASCIPFGLPGEHPLHFHTQFTGSVQCKYYSSNESSPRNLSHLGPRRKECFLSEQLSPWTDIHQHLEYPHGRRAPQGKVLGIGRIAWKFAEWICSCGTFSLMFSFSIQCNCCLLQSALLSA